MLLDNLLLTKEAIPRTTTRVLIFVPFFFHCRSLMSGVVKCNQLTARGTDVAGRRWLCISCAHNIKENLTAEPDTVPASRYFTPLLVIYCKFFTSGTAISPTTCNIRLGAEAIQMHLTDTRHALKADSVPAPCFPFYRSFTRGAAVRRQPTSSDMRPGGRRS